MASWVLSKGADASGMSEPQHSLALREQGGILGVTWVSLLTLCLFVDFPPWWKPQQLFGWSLHCFKPKPGLLLLSSL